MNRKGDMIIEIPMWAVYTISVFILLWAVEEIVLISLCLYERWLEHKIKQQIQRDTETGREMLRAKRYRYETN